MDKMFVPFLPPWAETGLQPAFYDVESGTVLQQTARMYDKVNQLTRLFNEFSEDVAETVNDYIERFNTLYNYVHDYFDNLDVQEEVNKKLDAMAEDGTLTALIADYLKTTAIWSFNSISDMKSSENLDDGSFAEICGYYETNDGAKGLYKIRSKSNDDVIDDNKIVQISNTLVAELINSSNINTKLGVNVRIDNQNINDIKSRIDTYKFMGVTEIVLPIHMEGDDCTARESIATVNQVIAYAIAKNITVNTIKFHCTDVRLKNSSDYQALYQQNCEDFLEEIEGTTIEKVIILNEMNSMFNSFATQEQADVCLNMVEYFKGLGYEVSISVAGLEYFLDCYYSYPDVTDSFDFVAINDYPVIGDRKNLTSDAEVKEVYKEVYALAETIKGLYPDKDFVISEIGVQNVWEALSAPANYLIEDMAGVTNAEGKIIPVFFSGLLNDNRLNELFSGVWLWYAEYYNNYAKETKIFRDVFVGGTN